MPKHNEYYIVEYRFPIKIDSVNSIQEAISMASQVFENQFDFKPENWNARIFKYSTDSASVGHSEEYFYNPNSATFREITKNLEYHSVLIKNGEVPESVKETKGSKNDKE